MFFEQERIKILNKFKDDMDKLLIEQSDKLNSKQTEIDELIIKANSLLQLLNNLDNSGKK